VPDFLSTYSYSYDAAGRLQRLAPNFRSTLLTSEVRNYTNDATGQVRQTTDEIGSVAETFSYDANGNRLGVRDAYDRLRDDASHRFVYNNEGQVKQRWSLETGISLGVNTDNQDGSNQAGTPMYSPEIEVQSSNQQLVEGWYRVRLQPLTITADVNPGPVEISLGVYHDIAYSPIDSTLFAPATQTVTLTATQDAHKFATSALVWDFFLPALDSAAYLYVNVHFTGSLSIPVPRIQAQGGAYLDRFTGVQQYTWDHRGRLVKAVDYGAPLSNTSAAPTLPNCTQVAEIVYQYDVFDNWDSRNVSHTVASQPLERPRCRWCEPRCRSRSSGKFSCCMKPSSKGISSTRSCVSVRVSAVFMAASGTRNLLLRQDRYAKDGKLCSWKGKKTAIRELVR
jgi:hypothetical protein